MIFGVTLERTYDFLLRVRVHHSRAEFVIMSWGDLVSEKMTICVTFGMANEAFLGVRVYHSHALQSS